MADCAYRPQVLHWARRYSANPHRFAANLEQAMPFLLLVADQIEQRDLPGELALLPYLESGYRPLRSKGNRPAGMWQIMPATARAVGLKITPDYDGRLDALASSTAALKLLARYHTEFGDWRLADMAFNAGEYRMKRALGERDAHALSAAELARLKIRHTTTEHLDKLLGLACVIQQPGRFGVTLPDADSGDMLQTVDLESGMSLRDVARFASMDLGEVKRFNACYLDPRASNSPSHFLLPANRIDGFRAAAGASAATPLADSH